VPRFLLCLSLLLALVLPAAALDIPKLTGHVNDRAGILSAQTELRLEQALTEFARSDSTQLVVLTIPSLEGESLEEYTLRVAVAWGIGQKGKDNGALLLVSRDDRKVRIEVGYGLEGRLTDLLAGRIIDYDIIPRFKSGDYDGGVTAGVVGMIEAVRGEYQGSGKTTQKKRRNPLGWLALLLFFGPALLSLGGVSSRRSYRRHGGFWIGGGGFGGGFGGGGGFSGGGGGFGGGGSSGSW